MPIIDPILSIVLSLFVLWNVFKIGRKLLRIFMQAMPEEIEMSKLRTQVSALSGVKEMHAIQGWSLDGEEHTLSVHLSVDSKVNFTQLMDLKCKVKDIFAQFHIRYSTIEFESDTDCCLEHDHEPAIKTKGHHHHHHH
jgi:cobalt-zinc-cadmium efflux system protein